MPIKLGTNGLGAIYQGTNKIASIYKGNYLVYQSSVIDPNVVALIERTITNVTADMIGNITAIGVSAFHSCRLLSNIEIPEGITTIGETAFTNCNSLENITLPSTITELQQGSFTTCENLKTMTILATTPPVLAMATVISGATTTIYVPSASVSLYETAEVWADLMTRETNPVTFVGI